MYKKTKYLIYASLILFAVFLLIALSKEADQKIAKENELIRQRNQLESIVLNEKETTEHQEENNITIQDNTMVESTIDIGQPPIDEVQTNIKQPKKERKIRSYYIHSSKFETIDTIDKDFGLIRKILDDKYYIVAQKLKGINNAILLYIFSRDGKLNWQGEIYNSQLKTLTLTSISMNENKLNVAFNQEGLNYGLYKTFIIEETSGELNVTPQIDDYTGYTITGTNADNCTLVFDFTVDNTRFFVIARPENKNTTSYAKYVNTSFYLYKEQNGILVYHSLLFQKTVPKDVMNIFEAFDMSDNGSSVVITMDTQHATKTIYKSQLTGKYAKFDYTHSLFLKPLNSVRTTKYDIEIEPVYE